VRQVLVLVTPDTVVRWQRRRFSLTPATSMNRPVGDAEFQRAARAVSTRTLAGVRAAENSNHLVPAGVPSLCQSSIALLRSKYEPSGLDSDYAAANFHKPDVTEHQDQRP
jgi:hypothetical protein